MKKTFTIVYNYIIYMVILAISLLMYIINIPFRLFCSLVSEFTAFDMGVKTNFTIGTKQQYDFMQQYLPK